METIHKSGASLKDVAKRIQQARKEWQAWDLGGAGGDKKLYGRFDKACTEAWKACAVYFAEQRRKRQQNSAQREKICEFLELEFEKIEWRNVQWKEVQQLIREQTTQWRKCGQADYKQHKSLQTRFSAILEKFDDHLERERERNFKKREKLIEDIVELGKRDDSSSLISEVQKLQKQWLTTVTSSRGKEQALWKRFTEVCDSVYDKRRSEQKEFKLSLQKSLEQREVLCKTIEVACATESEHAAIPTSLGKWQEQWATFGEMPRGDEKKINGRYRDAISQAKKVVAAIAQSNAQQTTVLLWEKSLLCAELEALLLTEPIVQDSERKTRGTQLIESWAAKQPLPTDLEKTVGERWQLADKALNDDNTLTRLSNSLADNAEKLHLLLLHLEILAELDSPAEFSKQRMAMQIERLSAAMGKGDGEVKNADELIREALLVGAVDARQHKPAFARLENCAKALGAKSAT